MAIHQIDRSVPLAFGAMAIGLTALAGTVGERAAQKPSAGGKLGDSGTQTALRSGEFCASERASHVLYQYYTRFTPKTRSKTQCEYAWEPKQVKTAMESDVLAV